MRWQATCAEVNEKKQLTQWASDAHVGEMIYIFIWFVQASRLKLTAYNNWITGVSLVL